MRLVQIGKILGMTGQQLRKELELVDFGVKPTDREVPDNLATGIIRFVARKHGITIDESLLTVIPGMEGGGDDDRIDAAAAPEAEAPAAAPVVEAPKVVVPESLHVLRKLTLDDVSREAAARHRPAIIPPRPGGQRHRPQQQRDRREKREERKPVAQQQIKKKEGIVPLPGQITVKELAEKTGIQVPQVVGALLKNGVLATITQTIDYETAAIVAAELGVQVTREQQEAKVEDLLSKNLAELIKDEPENLLERAPIVVVMGHVDHGKTSILDAIRKTNVVAGESGGITQHIGAYQVVHAGKPITFLDTPGHEAFTQMRARGAQITDIAILVVSAEEGVRPTTLEAIAHAKEAGVPLIVAINKIDRPNADPDRVKGELAAHGLQPEEWGGDTAYIATSAVTKVGIDTLLDTILLRAELTPFKANPNRRAIATVIESNLDPSLGSLATVIVNTGTLRVGDPFICGRTTGKIRSMTDATGSRLQESGPSGAVRISGFADVPSVGDIVQVMTSDREAKDLQKTLLDVAGAVHRKAMGDLVSLLHEGRQSQLKMVLKADAQGSLEALQQALDKLTTNDLSVKVIHSAIGAVSESDVMMAAASQALVVSFRAPVPLAVERTADREGVKIREYDVIYALLDDMGALLQGLLVPEEQEKVLGHLEVKEVFLTQKKEQIVGGRVTDGVVKRVQFRMMRGEQLVGTGRIMSLRKVDQDIKEAKADTECGMRVETTIPVMKGDIFEVFNKEFKKRED